MTTIANALLGFLMHLLRDPDAAEKFREDPDGELHRAGLDDVQPDDVDAVLPVVLDYAPIRVDTSFDRGPDAGGSRAGAGREGRRDGGGQDHDRGDWAHGRDDEHDYAVQQLTHLVNSYAHAATVDDGDTVTDQAVHHNVWADGGVLQWFDDDALAASGDGAVAPGDVDAHGSADSATTVGAHDPEVGTTDLDLEDSFYADHPTDASDHSADLTEDSFTAGSTHSPDLDLTDAFTDQATDVDVDLEDSFTPDDGADLKDADGDAWDSSTHDGSATIRANEAGTTDLPDEVDMPDSLDGHVSDDVAGHDLGPDTVVDDLGPDGLGDVPG
ncbi:IniB N-terminal domain-containing protein [Georgenia ruanii]|uniref:IniB N-terminal domain-containing protein n=1 Tax=Georgenia ruanii TaxID=348442 RepID=UPI00186AE00F|nr:IniB N-terminal domain-containing protein [Georgenia ruanii]